MEEKYQIILSIGIALVVGIPAILLYQKRIKEQIVRRKIATNKLLDLVSKGLGEKRIMNFIDFADFILGFEEVVVLNLSLPHSFEALILKVKHTLINEGKFNTEVQKTVEEIKIQIEREVRESELKEPFKNVPSSERNLLIDLLEMSQLKTNQVFVGKLHKLGDLIRIKEELFEKAGRDSEEALKITKTSKNLAILFFIISLVLSAYSFMK